MLRWAQLAGPPLGPALLVAASLFAPAVLTIVFAGRIAPFLPESSVVRIMTILFVAFALAVLASASMNEVWSRLGLPGRGPQEYLPFRWLAGRLATRRASSALLELGSTTGTREPLEALKDLARALEKRDLYTRAHSGRVSRLAYQVLERMGTSHEECDLALQAGVLHDIGKLAIPDSILFKPGRLDETEIEIMQTHPAVGAALVEPYTGRGVVDAVRHHHERFDAAGYPDGVLAGTLEIIARVIPVCDTYDALITDRPYHSAISKDEAFEELRAAAGSQLDPELVEILIDSERSKTSFPAIAAVLALILAPIGLVLRRARHAVNSSTAPASAAVAVMSAVAAISVGVGAPVPPRLPAALAPPLSAVAPVVASAVPEPATEVPSVAEPRKAIVAALPASVERDTEQGGHTPPPPPTKPCRLPIGTDLPVLPVVGCAADLLPV